MANQKNEQSFLFTGIYEFEDPSASLVAAKIPTLGSVDLYSGTVLIVKPNQIAMLIYKGQAADMVQSGTYQINTANVPVISKLANWKFGFESPLRCELIFFACQIFTSRRWGTPQPVLIKFQNFEVSVPIRVFGNFNVKLTNPKVFFTGLFGTKISYSIAEMDDFIQGQIIESLPEILAKVPSMEQLSSSFELISNSLEILVNQKLNEFGFTLSNLQVLSALPSKEIIEAMEAKSAIQIIGSQKEYLLYKAANSLGLKDQGPANDPLQMMMGLMLGKGLLLDKDSPRPEKQLANTFSQYCSACGNGLSGEAKFCPACGKKI